MLVKALTDFFFFSDAQESSNSGCSLEVTWEGGRKCSKRCFY